MKELITKINAKFEAFSNESAQQVEKGNKAAETRSKNSEKFLLRNQFLSLLIESRDFYFLLNRIVKRAAKGKLKKAFYRKDYRNLTDKPILMQEAFPKYKYHSIEL